MKEFQTNIKNEFDNVMNELKNIQNDVTTANTNIENINTENENINNEINTINTEIENTNNEIKNNSYKAAMYKYEGTGDIASSATIPFTKEIFNNTNGKIVFNTDGTIAINHTGFIKVSFGLWVHSSNASARPWARFRRKSDSFVFVDALNDISANYVVIGAANAIVPVAEGQVFELLVNVNAGDTYRLDEGNGFKNSYITIELL